jgi:hypothetical protein
MVHHTKRKNKKIKTLSLSSRSCIYRKQVCLAINKYLATAGKEKANVLQVTAPCLSAVCVAGEYNILSDATLMLGWYTYLCLTASVLD